MDNPGRWNSLGRRAVYCADSRALAALEILAHSPDKWRLRKIVFVAIPVDIPDDLVARPDRYPADWRKKPAPHSTRTFGDTMLAGHPVLRVPSAVVAGEFCYVLNPDHPAFASLKIGKPERFAFDARVLDSDTT